VFQLSADTQTHTEIFLCLFLDLILHQSVWRSSDTERRSKLQNYFDICRVAGLCVCLFVFFFYDSVSHMYIARRHIRTDRREVQYLLLVLTSS